MVVEAAAPAMVRPDGGAGGGAASVLNASGYVTARRRATVSSKITGKVVEVNVEEGMAVREGQVLARLDDAQCPGGAGAGRGAGRSRPAQRARERGPARRGAAAARAARSSCVEGRLVTAAEVDQAQAEVDSLDARIDAAREQVRVAERQIDVAADRSGQHRSSARRSAASRSRRTRSRARWCRRCRPAADSRAPASARIVDMQSLEIEVDVNEAYINRVTPSSRSPPCSTRIRTGRFRRTSSPWCRRPIGRRRPCSCASASRRSIRASCPTWA